MITTSEAFKASQAALVAEQKLKVIGVLRNVAAAIEGASVVSSSDFSTDYPAAGAIDGDATHLHYGPDASAEGGVGKSGWCSGDSSATTTKTSSADWNAGTKDHIAVLSGSAEPGFGTEVYQQDFDGLSDGTLVGQDSWADVSTSGGSFTVGAASKFGDEGKGVLATAPSDGQYSYIKRQFTAISTGLFSMRLKYTGNTPVLGFLKVDLIDSAGASVYALVFNSSGYLGTGTNGSDIPYLPVGTTWRKLDVEVNSVGNYTRVFLDGVQIYRTTGITIEGVQLGVQRTSGGATSFLIDDIRAGSMLNDNSTLDHVVDLGANYQSRNALAKLTMIGEAPQIFKRIAAGELPLYQIPNENVFRYSSATNYLAQTFTPTEYAQLDRVTILLKKVGSPQGQVWLEVRGTTGSPVSPTTKIFARSKMMLVSSLTTSMAPISFDFVWPCVFSANVAYSLVLRSDTSVSSSNYMVVGKVTTGGTTGSAYSSTDASTWTGLDAGASDLGFLLYCGSVVEVSDGGGGGAAALGDTTSHWGVGQSFQLTNSRQINSAAIQITPVGTPAPATAVIWAEIRSDDGAGCPSSTVLATSLLLPVDYILSTEITCFPFPIAVTLAAATTYHLVIRTNITVDGTNYFTLLYGVGSGGLTKTTSATAWAIQANYDLWIELRLKDIPYIHFQAAYSIDNITYGSFAVLHANPGQAATLTAEAVTGQLYRYWKVRVSFRAGSTQPICLPSISSWTLKVLWTTSQSLAIDFGVSRMIDRVEIYAHPILGGCREFKLMTSSDGVTYTNISDIDSTTLEARKRGGTATISSDPANPRKITMDGDFAGINFTASVINRYMKLVVQGNIDEYARILEIRAFRIVDLSSRVAGLSFSQSSDFMLRQMQARKASIKLVNTDGVLTSQDTAGAYYGQLGAGMKFLVWVGFREALDWVKLGVFYCESWPEQTVSGVISVGVSDGTWLLKTQVSTTAKVGYRNFEIIEYLANLAGFPSQDMTLDLTSSRVDYFAPKEVDVYSEIQQVAQASTFSQCYIDREGYLVLRAVGTSAGSTMAENVTGYTYPVADAIQTGDKPVFLNGDMYMLIVAHRSNADTWARRDMHLLLCKFVWATKAWTVVQEITKVVTTGGLVTGVTMGGMLFAWNGKLYVFCSEGAEFYSTANRIFEYDGTTLTQIYRDDGVVEWITNDEGGIDVPIMSCQLGQKCFFFSRSGSAGGYNFYEFDALTHVFKFHFSQIGTVEYIPMGLCTESERIFLAYPQAGGGPGPTTLMELNVETSAVTTMVQLDSRTTIVTGLDGTGAGELYFLCVPRSTETPDTVKIGKVNLDTLAITLSDSVSELGQATASSIPRNILDYADGTVMAAFQEEKAPYFIFYTPGEIPIKIPALSLKNFHPRSMAQYTREGQSFYYFFTGLFTVCEMQIGEALPAQDASVAVISTESGGNLQGCTLEAGPGAAGDDLTANAVIVKSKPWTIEAEETVWEASDLPWLLRGGPCTITLELSDPCLPSSLTYDVTYTLSGAATITLVTNTQCPTLTIEPTSEEGFISALVVKGQPLRQKGTTVAIAVGNKIYSNRYGNKAYTLENDYIYDPLSQAVIAADYLRRCQKPPVRISGVQIVSRWDLELFDRMTITDDFLKINGDAYITSIRHDWFKQDTTLDVVLI